LKNATNNCKIGDMNMQKDKTLIFYFRIFGFSLMMLLLLATAAKANPITKGETRLEGPIEATVIRVIDGDTIFVEAHVWLEQSIKTFIRLKGVDAAEKRAKCAYELEMANTATNFLKKEIEGKRVLLKNIDYGKYSRRVLADVLTQEREMVSEMLFERHLARYYNGGKRKSWC